MRETPLRDDPHADDSFAAFFHGAEPRLRAALVAHVEAAHSSIDGSRAVIGVPLRSGFAADLWRSWILKRDFPINGL